MLYASEFKLLLELDAEELERADIEYNKAMLRLEKGEGSAEVVALDAGTLDPALFRIPDRKGQSGYKSVFAPGEVRGGAAR